MLSVAGSRDGRRRADSLFGVSVFTGGSAYSMIRDIADGFIIPSELTFKRFAPADFAMFAQEVEAFTHLAKEFLDRGFSGDDVCVQLGRAREYGYQERDNPCESDRAPWERDPDYWKR